MIQRNKGATRALGSRIEPWIMSLAQSLTQSMSTGSRRTSVLARSALARAIGVLLVLGVLWLAVAWAVAVA